MTELKQMMFTGVPLDEKLMLEYNAYEIQSFKPTPDMPCIRHPCLLKQFEPLKWTHKTIGLRQPY